MYCPRCGHQPVSNELRFCSYCGFKLGVIKATLAEHDEEHAPTVANAEPVNSPPSHRNMNIGVIMMFLGAALSILFSGRPGGIGREGGAILLTTFFAVTLLFSSNILKAIYKLLSWGEPPPARLPTSRRELGFGAALMYLGTAVSAIISFLIAGRTKTTALPVSVLVLFSVLLVSAPYLLRALRYLIRDESSRSTNFITTGASLFSERALPPAQEFPMASLESARVTTSEIGLPVPSVTEQTTGLLSGK
jgi:hypothetical protein